MRTLNSAKPHRVQFFSPLNTSLCPAAILAAILAASLPATADTAHPSAQTTSTQPASHKSAHAYKRGAVAKPPAPVPQPPPEAAAPPPPPPPNWPANDHPTDATVVWNSQGLRIDAANSSLSQILKEVSTVVGTKVEGLGADQRIFGSYGPGNAREVLAKLLDGSGYNVLMIGDQGQGTPRTIILSGRPKGNAPQVADNPSPQNDENTDAEDQQPQPQPQPQIPSLRNGFTPGAPPRTPQQIMQEMQQRQMQQQQMPPDQPPQ